MFSTLLGALPRPSDGPADVLGSLASTGLELLSTGEPPTGASAQAMTNAAEMKLPATARPASASEASEAT